MYILFDIHLHFKGKKNYYDVSPLVDLDKSVCLAYKKCTCVLLLASFLSLTFLAFQQIAGSIRLAFKYSKNIPSRFLHLSGKKAQYPQNEPLPYIIDESWEYGRYINVFATNQIIYYN